MGKTSELSAIKNYELRGLGYIHELFEIIAKGKVKVNRLKNSIHRKVAKYAKLFIVFRPFTGKQ